MTGIIKGTDILVLKCYSCDFSILIERLQELISKAFTLTNLCRESRNNDTQKESVERKGDKAFSF